jgi:hypothetical protein
MPPHEYLSLPRAERAFIAAAINIRIEQEKKAAAKTRGKGRK